MLWRDSEAPRLANPRVIALLLDQALVASPQNPALHTKRAYVFLDRYDFASAAAQFEAAADLTALSTQDRARLARCYNMLGRWQDTLDLLSELDEPQFERAAAYLKLGQATSAERELRATLASEPNDHRAWRLLWRLLRDSDRIQYMLEFCEELDSHGARNAQFFFNWGWALALGGDMQRASRLLMEVDHIQERALELPNGFVDIATFNDALTEEILTNDNRLSDFPETEEANRGSSRVENLYAGKRPELIRLLLETLLKHAEAYRCSPRVGFDPWPRARPVRAHVKAWGLLQGRNAYEAAHIHPGGWISGVYYVRVPRSVDANGNGAGCIEFGPPAGLAGKMPGAAPTWRYAPGEGRFLLAPSHYPHRTIPNPEDEQRISVAFDIVPDLGADGIED